VTLPGQCGVPLLFSIQRLALEKPNAKPDYSLKRPSPARVPRGRQLQLAVYLGYNTVRTRTAVHECEQVWRGGTKIFTSCDHDSVRPSDQGGQEVFTDTFTPHHTGHFHFTVTAWSGSQRLSSSAWFWVTP
jgi:hypothetical protein